MTVPSSRVVLESGISGLALLCLSPVFVVIAVAILLDDPGTVFFRQRRVGRFGREFKIVKFRTMRSAPGTDHRFTPGDTRRVTRVGAFLRKWKLDELPQLWNVLKGEMAFVGPRPEVRTWVDAYPSKWAEILRVRPGITDPAAIHFRHEEKLLQDSADPEALYKDKILPKKLSLYEDYIAKRSVKSDIIVVLRTLRSVLNGTS